MSNEDDDVEHVHVEDKTLCPKCGALYGIGDYPFCKGGHRKSEYRVHGDETDYIDHNLGKEPIRIRSWSERRAIMAARGLQDYSYDVDVPEGIAPNVKRPSQWGKYRIMDPEYLKWLGERMATGHGQKEPDDPCPATVTVTELGPDR